MIIYDLVCDKEHRFEGWFRNSEDFTSQQTSGLLTCPMCNSSHIQKVPSGGHLQSQSRDKPEREKNDRTEIERQAYVQYSRQVMEKLNSFIEKNFQDVGNRLPEEARKIHYGESDLRNIRGTASAQDVQELEEEGIELIALSEALVNKQKLN